MWVDLLIALVKVVIVAVFVLSLAGLLTWVERKQSAVMQDRIGANRAPIVLPPFPGSRLVNWALDKLRALGLLHPLADMLKLFTKEDFVPKDADKPLHALAPFLSAFFALIGFAVIPFGDKVSLWGRTVSLQAVDLNVGMLYIFAVLSMGLYGVTLAGWASRNNFALLGGMRAAALMLSYEIAIGVSLVGICMVYGSLDLQQIAQAQQQPGHWLFGFLPRWGLFLQPIGFLLFLAAGIAATKRIPFDLPEGESEIIGYYIEYSGMKFGMFMLTDFIESVVIAGMATTLFLGAWQFPYLFKDGFHFPGGAQWLMAHGWVVLIQVLSFLVKVCFMLWLLMTVRWTLPRFRYDQAMRLGWLGLLPLSLLNIVMTGAVILWA